MIRLIQVALAAVVLLGGVLLAWTNLEEMSPDSAFCRIGLCGAKAKTVQTEPTNPFTWSDLAEERAASGDMAGARQAFARSIELGPHIPPVLMRFVNFEAGNGELERVVAQLRHVLELTPTYDNQIHRYLIRSGMDGQRILKEVLPDPGRGTAEEVGRPVKAGARHASAPDGEGRPKGDAARSWVSYLIADRRPGAEAAFLWLDERGGVTQALRNQWLEYVVAVQKQYSKALDLWARAAGEAGYPETNRLYNSRFARERTGARMDWTLSSHPHVSAKFGDGLTLTFDGAENLAYGHLSQQTYLPAGRWKFDTDAVADGLTTDQRPYFRIYDATDGRRLDVATPMAPERMAVEFTVPNGGSWVTVVLQRSQSGKFDNKIRGSLQLREVRIGGANGGR